MGLVERIKLLCDEKKLILLRLKEILAFLMVKSEDGIHLPLVQIS